MSRNEDIFEKLSFGAKFGFFHRRSIKLFNEGKQSNVTDFLSADQKQSVKSTFYPSENLNFFQDSQYIGNEVKLISKKESENPVIIPPPPMPAVVVDEETRRRMHLELLKKHKIHVKTTTLELPSLLTTFSELETIYNIRPYLYKNVVKQGYDVPFNVQMQGMPIMFGKMECLVAAPTGSGKTLTYVIPILSHLQSPSREISQKIKKSETKTQESQSPSSDGKKKKKKKKKKSSLKQVSNFRALVLVPTKVLCQQITRTFEAFGHGKPWVIRNIHQNDKVAIQQLVDARHKDILITTPNRLVQFMNVVPGFQMSDIEYIILDEADRLFDMGFLEQLDRIITRCDHPNVIRSLFSATLPLGVEHLAKTFLRKPITMWVGNKNTGAENITQSLHFVSNPQDKLMTLKNMFLHSNQLKPPILIFVNSVKRAYELYQAMLFDFQRVDYISSQRPERQVKHVIDQFRLGKVWALVCTDVMARGLDLLGVSSVLNYDFPRSEVEYIHRIGRTGRAGRAGRAVTFFGRENVGDLAKNVVDVMKRSGANVEDWVVNIIEKNKIKKQVKRKENTGRFKGKKRRGNFKRKRKRKERDQRKPSGGNPVDPNIKIKDKRSKKRRKIE